VHDIRSNDAGQPASSTPRNRKPTVTIMRRSEINSNTDKIEIKILRI